ncbi:hypothetical protein [Alkalicoccus halolimnae]|uniref:Uncharacterized protein n=1 Tax=Alkalicoccus halolimnae TaxID=1667239 RepID=A0A5C7FJJ3_9BACI|nr:hypothetical protein [Alkalicoccus halolimnae]TXF84676.1 hypothetical protein FTX54_10785 [Alkalicoccus halolimnae]
MLKDGKEDKEKRTETDVDTDEEKSEQDQETEEEESMPDSHTEGSDLPELTVGIIPAPEAASDLSNRLASELSDLLSYYVDDNYSWNVEIQVDTFVGVVEDATQILNRAKEITDEHEWDYTISITDLPLFKKGHFLVAEVDENSKMAQISLPSLGAAPLLRRVRESTLQLVSEMHHGSSEEARNREDKKISDLEPIKGTNLHKIGSRELIKRGWLKYLAPIYRVVSEDEKDDSEVRYVARPRLNGYSRVTTGMVRANHPWRVVTTFKSVIAVAFATGAYALIFPTVWMLADSYDEIRALVLMVIALTAMTGWMIITHGLWERNPDKQKEKHLTRLHNASTLGTIGIGVIIYYAALLLCFLAAVFMFIPPDLLESHNGIGRPADIAFYFYLAWLVTSIATVIGAIGAGLEDEETVLKGTYGYRQRARQAQLKNEEEEAERKRKEKRKEEQEKKDEEKKEEEEEKE